MESYTKAAQISRGEKFADYVISRLHTDNAFAAMLRKADNPATEYQSWEHLVNWCDLEKPWERLPFALIAAALARAKPKKDGYLGIGQSIRRCYDKGSDDAAKARLRRLLACASTQEACRNLRHLLRLIQSRGVTINYGGLLNELIYFGERNKLRWAADFYGRGAGNDSDNT